MALICRGDPTWKAEYTPVSTGPDAVRGWSQSLTVLRMPPLPGLPAGLGHNNTDSKLETPIGEARCLCLAMRDELMLAFLAVARHNTTRPVLGAAMWPSSTSVSCGQT